MARTNSHTISHAESLYYGDAFQAGAEGDQRGIPMASLVQVDLGTPVVADPNGIVTAETLGAAGDFTLDGALVTSGVAIMDVPRGVVIVNAGASTTAITFYGTDKYGVPISEAVATNGATPAYGLKAFKTVTRVAAAGDTTGNLTVGTSDVLGLPFRLQNVADVSVINENDNNIYQVTDATASNPASATAAAAAITGAVDALTGSASAAVTAAADALTGSASAAVTNVVPVITWSSNEPGAADAAITIANGSAIADAETAEWIQEMETFALAVNADIDENKLHLDLNAADLVLQKVVIDANSADIAENKLHLDLNAADLVLQKVVIDANIDDILLQKTELDKLITDVGLIRAEVIKLVTDVGAVDTGSLVKADATTATDATGDVRGTYNPTMVLDGAKALKLTYKPQGRGSRTAYGVTQYRKST